jgi:hypothetical protein
MTFSWQLEFTRGKVTNSRPKEMLDGGPSARNSPGLGVRLALIAQLNEVHASVISGGAWESAEGYRQTDPHRPALTAHTENIARTLGARLFGKWQ